MHRRFEITANELRPQSLDNYSAECYRVRREASLMQETGRVCHTVGATIQLSSTQQAVWRLGRRGPSTALRSTQSLR